MLRIRKSISNASFRDLKICAILAILFLIARDFDLDYSRRKECRSRGRRTRLIPVLILRERHFYHASYGCARRVNYGLSFRGQPKSSRRSITRDSGLGVHFFLLFLPFAFSFILSSHEKDTRSGRPRERQRADANEEDSSRLVAGMDSSDSFSLMKESSVRLCN